MAEAVRAPGTLTWEIVPDERASGVVVDVLGPAAFPGRQKVLSKEWSERPTRERAGADGTNYAVFEWRQLRAAKSLSCKFEVETLARGVAGTLRDRPPELRGPGDASWLAAEKWLEADAAEIVAAARPLRAADRAATVKSCWEFVRDHVKYAGYVAEDQGAARTLKIGTGDCTDFTDLFVALCRAAGVPARHCVGFLTGPAKASDVRKHSWAEAHLGDAGWAMLDPLHAAEGSHAWDAVRNRYVWLSRLRNDPQLGGYDSCRWKTAAGQLKIAVDLKLP